MIDNKRKLQIYLIAMLAALIISVLLVFFVPYGTTIAIVLALTLALMSLTILRSIRKRTAIFMLGDSRFFSESIKRSDLINNHSGLNKLLLKLNPRMKNKLIFVVKPKDSEVDFSNLKRYYDRKSKSYIYVDVNSHMFKMAASTNADEMTKRVVK